MLLLISLYSNWLKEWFLSYFDKINLYVLACFVQSVWSAIYFDYLH